MKLGVFTLAVIALVQAQNGDDKNRSIGEIFSKNPGPAVPPGFEIVPGKSTLGDYGALERCGEGSQAGQNVCVPYYNCDPATKTVTEEQKPNFGAGIIDIRAGFNECESYLDVCCQLPKGGTSPAPPTEPTKPPPPKESFCGIRNSKGIDFQITGNTNEAEYGEFPWMVAILRANYNPAKDESLAICGGSLIAPSVVLTGAHCVYKFKTSDIIVRAGEWDTQTTKERLPYQERTVQNIVLHPDFHTETLFNDFALLILTTPVDDKADNVGTVCLPPQGQQFFSENCFASGWGKKEFGAEGVYSVILKKIELPIVQRPQCLEDLRKTRLGKYFELHDSFICAGGEEGKDTCTGDGGSPLVCPDPENPGRYQQAGIVAWGIGCGDKKVPGVYGDVSSFRNWIDEQMKRLNLDTRPYYV